MPFFRAVSIFGVTLCALAISVAAHAQQTPPKESPLHYFNGAMRVELAVAHDELAVPGTPGRRLPLQALAALTPGGSISETESGGAFIRYATPAADLNALQSRAAAVRALGHRVTAVVYPPGAPRTPEFRETVSNLIAVKLKGGATIADVAAAYGLRVVRQVDYSAHTYVVEAESGGLFDGTDVANAIHESGLAEFSTPLLARQQSTRLIPNDTLFGSQWHLRNTGQVPGVPGEDVNITGAWDSYTGGGVNIAISDSGVLVTHPDLAPNARTDIDIDINGGDDDPSPSSDSHGTGTAGIAAARGNNGIGVVGSAFNAGIVGIRLIDGPSDDQDEADAMNHQVGAANPANYVHVNNNSWGPADCGCILGGMGPLTEAALANGVNNGRGGRGTVYVWAAGNGRTSSDNVNVDAYASSRYTIAVGATGANGQVSWYSEKGASMLVNATSSDAISGTTTTTLGNSYTNGFGGTSSAAPLAAGVIALMLEANPGLGWRDVQYILVDTAEKNHPAQADWKTNSSGRLFNHNYGFGRVDATAAVAEALDWAPVPPYTAPATGSATPIAGIPDNNSTGAVSSVVISGAPADFFIEHVEVEVDIAHPRRGQLQIVLTAPSTFQSELVNVRNDTGANYPNWRFTSVAHWGENPNGTWQLAVRDLSSGFTGTLNSWNITIYGHEISVRFPGPPLDTDQDLLPDEDEINIHGTDPFNPDTDGDGVPDGIEIALDTDPLDPDDFPVLPAANYPHSLVLFALLVAVSMGAIVRNSHAFSRRNPAMERTRNSDV